MTSRTPPASNSQAPVWEVWEEHARLTLVNAMKQRRIGYKILSRELERFGIYESPGQLNRKVNRKKFSAAFLLACLEAIDPDGEV